MILPIYAYGHPVLRKKSEDISPDYPKLKELIENMFETMKATNGVGLAAPQIGLNIKLIVIDASPYAEEEPELKDFVKVLINPIIISENGKSWLFNEGCLSIPGIREDILRKSEIKISYLDENFQKHEEIYTGRAARIIQHEYDHLNGVLFIDHLSPLKKTLLKSKLNNIARGKVKAEYKMKFADKVKI